MFHFVVVVRTDFLVLTQITVLYPPGMKSKKKRREEEDGLEMEVRVEDEKTMAMLTNIT